MTAKFDSSHAASNLVETSRSSTHPERNTAVKPKHLTPAQLDSLLAQHGFTRLQIRHRIGGLLYGRDGRILFVFTWMNTRISPLAAIIIREVEGELPEITRDSQQIHARESARVEFRAGAWPLPESSEAELARILSEVTT